MEGMTMKKQSRFRTFTRIVLLILIPLMILGAGAAVTAFLIKTRAKAKKNDPERAIPLVEVIPAELTSHQVIVAAMGTVLPAKQVIIQPQVSGQVIEHSPNLVPGGRFSTGDIVSRIDPRDYELAIIQQKASVERARFELKVEEGRQQVARREWHIMEKSSSMTTNQDLALRKPHLEAARASLASADSRLKQAEISLARTTIKAPFNSFVQEEFIEVGQLVSPQSRIATLVGTDQFWVQVSLPVNQLTWINIPLDDESTASPATVLHRMGAGKENSRKGKVLRLLGDLDPVGRMARVLIAVDDPLGIKDSDGPEALPLLVGAYVEVKIKGKELRDVFAVPRLALHDLNRVWIMNSDDLLEFREIAIIWRSEDTIFVTGGLQQGERIITSQLPSPVPGTQLRVEE